MISCNRGCCACICRQYTLGMLVCSKCPISHMFSWKNRFVPKSVANLGGARPAARPICLSLWASCTLKGSQRSSSAAKVFGLSNGVFDSGSSKQQWNIVETHMSSTLQHTLSWNLFARFSNGMSKKECWHRTNWSIGHPADLLPPASGRTEYRNIIVQCWNPT